MTAIIRNVRFLSSRWEEVTGVCDRRGDSLWDFNRSKAANALWLALASPSTGLTCLSCSPKALRERQSWQCAAQTSLADTNVQQRPSVCSMSPGVSYSRSCRALGRSFPAFAERMRMYPFAHRPERMNGIHLNMKKAILIVAGLLLSVGMMASAAPVSQDGPPPLAGTLAQVDPPQQPQPPPPPPPKHRHRHHRQSPTPPPPPPRP